MRLEILIEMDSDVDILATDDNGDALIGNAIAETLGSLNIVWPEIKSPDGGKIMPSTIVNVGRKIVHAELVVTAEDPLAAVDGLIGAYSLGWVIHGLRSRYKQALVDEFDEPLLDEDGNQTMELTVYKQPTQAAFSPFLEVGTIFPYTLHKFAGSEDWIIN